MDKKALLQVKILFGIRILLWITAVIPTIYWVYYQQNLYDNGIFDVYEYSTLLRPVFYRCLGISLAAICVSFILRAVSDHVKKK